MTSQTPLPYSSRTLNDNSNSLYQKAEDEDTNHTTALQKIKMLTYEEDPPNEQSGALENEEKVG